MEGHKFQTITDFIAYINIAVELIIDDGSLILFPKLAIHRNSTVTP